MGHVAQLKANPFSGDMGSRTQFPDLGGRPAKQRGVGKSWGPVPQEEQKPIPGSVISTAPDDTSNTLLTSITNGMKHTAAKHMAPPSPAAMVKEVVQPSQERVPVK